MATKCVGILSVMSPHYLRESWINNESEEGALCALMLNYVIFVQKFGFVICCDNIFTMFHFGVLETMFFLCVCMANLCFYSCLIGVCVATHYCICTLFGLKQYS